MRIIQRELLVKEDGIAYLSDVMSKNYTKEKCLNTPKKIVDMMNEVYNLQNKAEEFVYLIVMDTKSKPLSIFQISHGSINASLVDVRGIMLKTLLSNGVNIVIVHNHPSGNTEPSREDIRVTKKIKSACELMELYLLDHIIIGRNSQISLKEIGII